ncbi:transglutaminase-like cysteine peptidase [Vibrio parahaemolyticus]|nr:transglutaminase-like cysteine peptidase [Vibrio parahaemolyticus]
MMSIPPFYSNKNKLRYTLNGDSFKEAVPMFGFLLCCPALLIACYAVGNDDVILLQSIQQRYSTIQYVSDEALYGQKEYWATPNETLSRWQGDCEDISIVKYFALIKRGLTLEQVRLAYLQLSPSTFHMVVEVHLNQSVAVLDNRYVEVRRADATYYKQRIFTFNQWFMWVNDQVVGPAPERMGRWADLLARLAVSDNNSEVAAPILPP